MLLPRAFPIRILSEASSSATPLRQRVPTPPCLCSSSSLCLAAKPSSHPPPLSPLTQLGWPHRKLLSLLGTPGGLLLTSTHQPAPGSMPVSMLHRCSQRQRQYVPRPHGLDANTARLGKGSGYQGYCSGPGNQLLQRPACLTTHLQMGWS